jgi:hypothetical protein
MKSIGKHHIFHNICKQTNTILCIVVEIHVENKKGKNEELTIKNISL